MNNQGLEGSVNLAAMAEKGEVTQNQAQEELQSKTGSGGKADPAGIGSSTQQCTSAEGDCDDNILGAEQEINAKMEAAE